MEGIGTEEEMLRLWRGRQRCGGLGLVSSRKEGGEARGKRHGTKNG